MEFVGFLACCRCCATKVIHAKITRKNLHGKYISKHPPDGARGAGEWHDYFVGVTSDGTTFLTDRRSRQVAPYLPPQGTKFLDTTLASEYTRSMQLDDVKLLVNSIRFSDIPEPTKPTGASVCTVTFDDSGNIKQTFSSLPATIPSACIYSFGKYIFGLSDGVPNELGFERNTVIEMMLVEFQFQGTAAFYSRNLGEPYARGGNYPPFSGQWQFWDWADCYGTLESETCSVLSSDDPNEWVKRPTTIDEILPTHDLSLIDCSIQRQVIGVHGVAVCPDALP